MQRTFLTAEWHKLIMAQYEVDPAILSRYIPRGLELELFRGRSYVSLVGFLFKRVRIKGFAIPLHTRFEEVNLRFYVTHTLSDGTRRRGVVFVREFVPRRAITFVARFIYEEPYATRPMRSYIEVKPDALSVSYSWRNQRKWHNLTVRASPVHRPIESGSEEEFVTEHYWGYTKRSHGSTSEYGVLHPRWSVYPVKNFTVEVDFSALYGRSFAVLNSQQPASIILAEGSEVAVLHGSRLLSNET